MKRQTRMHLVIEILFCFAIFHSSAWAVDAMQTEKWQRTVVSFQSDGYEGNPFEAEIDVVFTHLKTGTSIVLPAYFAGGRTWKAGFLPEITGTWRYQVTSGVSSFGNISGLLDVSNSDRYGKLQADTDYNRKWRLADGPLIIPIALRMEFALPPDGHSRTYCNKECWLETVRFLRSKVNAHFFDTRLQDEFDTTMNAFEGEPKEHRFSLTFWDQLERRMQVLADEGAGAYVMFYSDDDGAPKWDGQSETERLLIRYAVARLSGFPLLIWDTGIDIAEYRSRTDVNWFGETLADLDPFDHPVASRIGGGSGFHFMRNRTYESMGDPTAEMTVMADYFGRARRPILMSDSFAEARPDTPAKNFTPDDIRRAAWKAVMAGGLGIVIRGSDGYFYPQTVEEDLESEQWLRLINEFVENQLGDAFAEMTPCPSLIGNGFCLANPDRSVLLAWTPGPNDRFDPTPGRELMITLQPGAGSFNARWFNPRNGEFTDAQFTVKNKVLAASLPSDDDWLLVLTARE